MKVLFHTAIDLANKELGSTFIVCIALLVSEKIIIVPQWNAIMVQYPARGINKEIIM